MSRQLKRYMHELQTDLKALVFLGGDLMVSRIEQLLRGFPRDELNPSQLIPIGQSLSHLDQDQLTPFIEHSDPILRGLGAAALGEKFLAADDIRMEVLLRVVRDPVVEVRNTMVLALKTSKAEVKSPQLLALIEVCFESGGDADLVSALSLVSLVSKEGDQQRVRLWLRPLDRIEDHDIRRILVNCLQELAEAGAVETVLISLRSWAQNENPNVWLITRSLSASWTREYPSARMEILDLLAGTVGNIRAVQRAKEKFRKEI